MISISIFLLLASSLLSAGLIIDLIRTRRSLYTRISGLSPGALDGTIQIRAKRGRRISKELSLLVDFELTELVAMLAAVLQSGQTLFAALQRITAISRGVAANEISVLLRRIELGGDITGELAALCERVPTDSIREFTNKLSLAIARGTPLGRVTAITFKLAPIKKRCPAASTSGSQ